MFIAINTISCSENYKDRFEELMLTRAKQVDTMPGFINMEVLKPQDKEGDYLIISHWESEEQFKQWARSPEFSQGHNRGFEDIAKARAEGNEPPMKSIFKTYKILTR